MNNTIITHRARKRIRFTKPKEQLHLILPTLTIFTLTVIIAYLVIVNLQNAAVQALFEQGVEKEGLLEFTKTTNGYLSFFGISLVALAVIGFYWTWNISFKIFGPIPRLERELSAIQSGVMDPAGLRVRDKDMLYTIIKLVRNLLTQKGKK